MAEPAAEPDESASTAGEPGDSEQQGASGVAGDGKSWILDSNNWQQGEGMLPPVVLERVKKGDYWYTVVPVDPVEFKQNYSTKFWEASESNAGKYDVDPDHLWAEGRQDRQDAGLLLRLPIPTHRSEGAAGGL